MKINQNKKSRAGEKENRKSDAPKCLQEEMEALFDTPVEDMWMRGCRVPDSFEDLRAKSACVCSLGGVVGWKCW